jgi:hypothetical protein
MRKKMSGQEGWSGRWVFMAALIGMAACAPGGDPVDPRFEARVDRPAHAPGTGPLVMFDEGHHNVHRARASYRPFVELLEADGYQVRVAKAPLTAASLGSFAVLVTVLPQGTNEANDNPAFEEAECDAVRDWVAAGGALLLVTDHYPFGHAAESLARRFNVRFSKGVVEDPVRHDPAYDSSHLVFAAEHGGLGDHPIITGRDPSERLRSVLTFTGQGVEAAAPAIGLLRLSGTAVALAPHATVERRGSDVLVHVEYKDPQPAPGWTQGVAIPWGRGRVVVLGEAAMLSARLRRNDGKPIGMNVEGYDNRQLALNIMHWLTGII